MWILASATRAEHVPEQIMKLTGVLQTAVLRDEHQCFVHGFPDRNVLPRCNVLSFNEFVMQRRIANLNGTNS